VTSKAKTKQPPADDIVRPQQGYLECDTCKTVVSYRGYPAPTAKDPWPKHRCGFVVREFDRFSLEDRNFRPIPKVEP
jgi:hypothetical protein